MKIKVYVDEDYEVFTEKEAREHAHQTVIEDTDCISEDFLPVQLDYYSFYDMVFNDDVRDALKTELDNFIKEETERRMELFYRMSEIEV